MSERNYINPVFDMSTTSVHDSCTNEISDRIKEEIDNEILRMVHLNSLSLEEKMEKVISDPDVLGYIINPEEELIKAHELKHKL